MLAVVVERDDVRMFELCERMQPGIIMEGQGA